MVIRPRQAETHQLAVWRFFGQYLERAFSDEIGFLPGHGPVHADLHRMGHGVGILAHDDMSFLQPQYALSLHAKGLQPGRASCFQDVLPGGLRSMERQVDFEAKFAHEADPDHPGIGARKFKLPRGQKGHGLAIQFLTKAGLAQNVSRSRARHVKGGPCRPRVDDIDPQSPLGLPPEQVPIHPLGCPGGGGHVKTVGREPARHTVVDDGPRVIDHQRVA